MLRNFSLTKRHKFFLTTVGIAVLLLLIRVGGVSLISWRFRVLFFALVSAAATVWSLKDEDFSGVEWVTLTILPIMFAVSGSLVYPLLPREVPQIAFWTLDTDSALVAAVLIKIIYLVVFSIGFYAILLTENIFNIAALKTIQLTRVGHSVGFFLTLVTALLFSLVIYSLHLSSFGNFIATLIMIFPLSLQSVWSFILTPKIDRAVMTFALAISLALAQVAWVLSFWPITNFIFALFLTALLYELVGVVQYYLSDRLTKSLIIESVFVMSIFLMLTILSASWGG